MAANANKRGCFLLSMNRIRHDNLIFDEAFLIGLLEGELIYAASTFNKNTY